jgi:hypothetical protein
MKNDDQTAQMHPQKNLQKQRKQELLIQALLQHAGLLKAADSIGISRQTAWRISKTAEFQEQYLKARREAHAQTLARLQQAGPAAASTLLKVMLDPGSEPPSRIRAAESVLRHGADALELEDFAVRLERLERKK